MAGNRAARRRSSASSAAACAPSPIFHDSVNARSRSTRCASITGACVALADAIAWCSARGLIATDPRTGFVAAVSVGVVGGVPVLDLDYAEDSDCGTDMNVVMTESGGFVELQGTAEGEPFSRSEMDALVTLADQGIRTLIAAQRAAFTTVV